jgi:hypothetical protein
MKGATMIRSRLMLSRGGLGLLGVLSLAFASALMGGACGGGGSATPDGGGAGTGGGGHGGAGTGGAITGTPVELCNTFAATICTRLKACPDVLADPTTFDEADCEKKNKIGIGCERATSAGFSDCLKDVTNLSCKGLFSPTDGLLLPGSCDEPLNIDLSTAQKKCADLALADCSRFFECNNFNATADDLQACQADDYSSIGCAFATDVGATFDQCKLDIANAPCSAPDGGASADAGEPTSTACDTAITFVQ